jgi:hypothetical protein
MNSTITPRKPKLHFETADAPSHVTFDDGKVHRRNVTWLHYVSARWDYAEPDVIKIEMGDCVVLLRGHNLEPLYHAIEDRTLARVRAQPQLEREREREMDTFVVEIRFSEARKAGASTRAGGQMELL